MSSPALLIDLDGTLVDSAGDLGKALNQLRQDLDRSPLDNASIRKMIGNGIAKLIERGLTLPGETLPNDRDFDQLLALFEGHYDHCLLEKTRPYPEVPDTLQRLTAAGWRLAVCTNKPKAASQKILQALNLAQFFEVVTGGDSYRQRKPAAEPLLGTLTEMGCNADRAIVVGDSWVDFEAACNAALPVVLMRYGYSRVPVDELNADRILDHFGQLPSALEQLTNSIDREWALCLTAERP